MSFDDLPFHHRKCPLFAAVSENGETSTGIRTEGVGSGFPVSATH
jgi:hypothetical protein